MSKPESDTDVFIRAVDRGMKIITQSINYNQFSLLTLMSVFVIVFRAHYSLQVRPYCLTECKKDGNVKHGQAINNIRSENITMKLNIIFLE